MKNVDPAAVRVPGSGEREQHPLFSFSQPVGMITAQNPRFPSVPGENEALKNDLDTMGVKYHEVDGHYGAPEQSFLVYDLPREHLLALGKKYGQEAVIHNEGGKREFHYTNGPNAGMMHPGLPTFERWSDQEGPPEDYYTSIPGHGHVRLHFDFDQLQPSQVQPGHPAPAPLNTDGPVYATKHELLNSLYNVLKKTLDAARRPVAHPHAYRWHDGHSDHHYRGHGPGGVLISSKLRKDEGSTKHPHTDGALPNDAFKSPAPEHRNEQAAGVGVKTYAQVALPFGHINEDAKKAGGSDLFHYDYRGKGHQVDQLVKDHGFQTYYAGGKFGKPDLHNRNYNTKHLMVYDPTPQSGGDFGDLGYTDAWRKTHELSHALVYPELNQIYGEGRRIGKLGRHRTLREAQRAVHWEWLAAHKQRELNKSLGIEVPDEVFNKELNTVMHDAVHRAITGQFTEPSQEGFTPHSHKVPLETSLGMIREAARNLGLTGEHDLLKKSEHGSNEVADENKTLSIPEALHELHKGLKEKVTEFEQKCLDLRKAELAKNAELGPQAYDAMNKNELCKACGEKGCDCKKVEAYAKGELKMAKLDPTWSPHSKPTASLASPWDAPPPVPKTASPGVAKPFKAPIKKDEPAGSMPDSPGKKLKPISPNKDMSDPEGGNDGDDVKKMKKAALPAGKPTMPKMGTSGVAGGAVPAKPQIPGAAPVAKKKVVSVQLGASPKPGVLPSVLGKAGAGFAPGKPTTPKMGTSGVAGGAVPKQPKIGGTTPSVGAGFSPGKSTMPKMGSAGPAGGAAPPKPKTPAMGAGTPQMKAETKPEKGTEHKSGHCSDCGKTVSILADGKFVTHTGRRDKTCTNLNPKYQQGPMKKTVLAPPPKKISARDQADQAAKLPGVRAAVGSLMDDMLAAGPKKPALKTETKPDPNPYTRPGFHPGSGGKPDEWQIANKKATADGKKGIPVKPNDGGAK